MKKLNSLPILTLLLLSVLSIESNAQQNTEGKPPVENQFTIENCVNKFDMNKIDKTSVGYQYWFVDKEFLDGRTLKMSVVAPHQATHAPHRHIEDEFFFVLEGEAQFYLDGKTTKAAAYASFYCPSGAEHGIENIGDTELKYLVIKKYQK
jgi:mannose-6-phosphate isomerase-like protein (cupin superfamily)